MLIAIIITGLFLIMLVWILVERKQLVITRYDVISDKLPKAFHNTGFVVLADLHNSKFGKNNERLIRRIESCSPEFIIVAGDMINKKRECYPSDAFSLLAQLAKKYKIYYAYGNHELRMEKQYSERGGQNVNCISSTWVECKKQLKRLGVVFLDNDTVFVEKGGDGIRISGVTIGEKFFEHGKLQPMGAGYLASLLGDKPEKEYQILIAHNPAYFLDYISWGGDIVLSGHVHGGLLRLPLIGGVISPQVRLFPKYSSGLHKENGQQMIVSRGLGSHSLMPRIFNPPEIVHVILKSI